MRVLPIFRLIQEQGSISEHDMFNTFNMGVGMILIVPSDAAGKALDILKDSGEDAYVIGEIVSSPEKIEVV